MEGPRALAPDVQLDNWIIAEDLLEATENKPNKRRSVLLLSNLNLLIGTVVHFICQEDNLKVSTLPALLMYSLFPFVRSMAGG